MSAPSRRARRLRSSFVMELRSAWRTLRARRLVTGLHVTLVALVVAASGVIFAAAFGSAQGARTSESSCSVGHSGT